MLLQHTNPGSSLCETDYHSPVALSDWQLLLLVHFRRWRIRGCGSQLKT